MSVRTRKRTQQKRPTSSGERSSMSGRAARGSLRDHETVGRHALPDLRVILMSPTWVRPLASPLHVPRHRMPTHVMAGGPTRGLCRRCTGARRPSRGDGHVTLA